MSELMPVNLGAEDPVRRCASPLELFDVVSIARAPQAIAPIVFVLRLKVLSGRAGDPRKLEGL
jgi:hypothetical protein